MRNGIPAGPLDEAVITGELDRRPTREPDFRSENEVLGSLAEGLASGASHLLQSLCDCTLRLTRSGSAGISLLEADGEDGAFRRVAAAGALASFADRPIDPKDSFCGMVLAAQGPMLLGDVARHFAIRRTLEPAIVEALLVPITQGDRVAGVLWAVKHDKEGHFDREDVRLMTSLSRFAAAAGERDKAAAERATARSRLAASERRMDMLVSRLLPQLVWRADAEGRWTWASPQWSDYSGQTGEESEGLGWLRAVHDDDRESVTGMWEAAAKAGELSFDCRLAQNPAGTFRWFQARATPAPTDGDGPVEWLGTFTDIDDLRRLQEQQRHMGAELQHRVRNMLSIARSVFIRTWAAGGDMEELISHFSGRLDSLARTQMIVSQRATRHVDLEDLIRDELISVGVSDGPLLTLAGPEVRLPAAMAESLGLAIHELTTNAVKYGALRVAGGALSIGWTVRPVSEEGKMLELSWTERGVPAIPVEPIHRGFGRELIEEALPYQLGATTRLDIRGGGVRCHIAAPLRSPHAEAG